MISVYKALQSAVLEINIKLNAFYVSYIIIRIWNTNFLCINQYITCIFQKIDVKLDKSSEYLAKMRKEKLGHMDAILDLNNAMNRVHKERMELLKTKDEEEEKMERV